MQQPKQTLVVGHRGAHGVAPQNTLASFDVAIIAGAQQVETDLRLSADGVVVLIHDPEITGKDGGQLSVADTTYTVLKTQLPSLVTLDELIRFVDHRSQIMLEFKALAAVEPALRQLRSLLTEGWAPDDFIFASFEFPILEQLHEKMPEIELVVLEEWSSVRARRRARKLGTEYLSMDQRFLWWGSVWWLSRRYKLYTYPYARLLPIHHRKPILWRKFGLYGHITDYPDQFLR